MQAKHTLIKGQLVSVFFIKKKYFLIYKIYIKYIQNNIVVLLFFLSKLKISFKQNYTVNLFVFLKINPNVL